MYEWFRITIIYCRMQCLIDANSNQNYINTSRYCTLNTPLYPDNIKFAVSLCKIDAFLMLLIVIGYPFSSWFSDFGPFTRISSRNNRFNGDKWLARTWTKCQNSPAPSKILAQTFIFLARLACFISSETNCRKDVWKSLKSSPVWPAIVSFIYCSVVRGKACESHQCRRKHVNRTRQDVDGARYYQEGAIWPYDQREKMQHECSSRNGGTRSKVARSTRENCVHRRAARSENNQTQT